MASWDSQGEIVPIELPNPEETQIWEGENESIRPRQHLILQLPVVIAFFIWQARIGSYGNGLIDVDTYCCTCSRLRRWDVGARLRSGLKFSIVFVFYAYGSQFLAKSTWFHAGEFLFIFFLYYFFQQILQARADLRVIKTHREGSLWKYCQKNKLLNND